MKKIISLILTLIMIAATLVGCNKKISLPDWRSGSDAARLLLADQRLDADLLKTKGGIFENGVEVMNNLAQKAKDNLGVRYLGASEGALSLTKTATVIGENTRGTLVKDGDKFIWSNFVENNNSYDYFENLTGNIVFSAEIAADLIDNIKKNVRVVDKWVKMGDTTKFYLHVEENSELLIEHYTADGLDIVNLCTRYKNAAGKDVYELYRRSNTENYEERMTYIPGERYEITMKNHWEGPENVQVFVADNSKGYWETCVMSVYPDNYHSVSFFVMKDNLCYDAFYNPLDASIPMLKVMSADKATDILNVYSDRETYMNLTIKFSGFDGIKSVEANTSDVEYSAEYGYANLTLGEVGTINFTNGRKASYNDEFVNGKVKIGAINVIFGGDIYTGEMMVQIEADSISEQFDIFKQFLAETGMSCRRNMDSVLAGINVAYTDVDGIIKYYKWNGISIIDTEGINAAKVKEDARIAQMAELYHNVKNAEVIDINDTERIELNIKFAPITASSFNEASLDAMKLHLGSTSLTIEDTTLYVKDEPYKVMLALADSAGGLVHLDIENTDSVKYAEEDIFTVTASALELTLPVLSSGDYTLVAYIATSDGIRASAFTPVAVANVSNMPISFENITVSATSDKGGGLLLSYVETKDFTVKLTTESRLDYEEFKAIISEKAFNYGTPSETVEFVADDAFTALSGEETEIADGTYRISYRIENGDKVVEGYIYVEYSVK